MKHLSVSVVVAFVISACIAAPDPVDPRSDWIMLDDFEAGQTLNGWTVFDAQNDTDPFVLNAQISDIRSEEDSGNHYLLRKPAADGIVGNRKALIWKDLPVPVAVGETATVFTRINVEYFPNNHAFGLSNQPSERISEISYDAFEPMIRVTDKAESDGTKNDGTLMVLVGEKNYAKINNPASGGVARPLMPGKWYDLWYVVDNAARAGGGQSYSLYVRGGEFPQQTLVYENAQFRIGREQALTAFMAICNTGPVKGPYGNGGVGYDDIYMAKGEVLSSPLEKQ